MHSKPFKIISPLALAVFISSASTAYSTTLVEVTFDHLTIGNPDGLDDGDRIQDVSGNGYHGFWGATNSNVPIVATPNGTGIDTSGAFVGKVFLRDGLTSIPDAWDGPTTTVTPYFTFDGSQSYTFEAVVNWNFSTQQVNGLMGQVGGSQLWIRERDGYLHYAFGVENVTDANLFSNTIDIRTAKADGNWHGIAVVYDGPNGEIRSYLDGSLVHTNTDPDIGSLGTMVNGTSDFFIGAYNGVSSNYFDGLQDTYRISTGALEPSEFLVIPEPQSILLSSLLAGLGLVARRRRA
ncbi:MAG: LamG-like jellyroll fold domain-containing protein [Luteolibacter sp.]